MSDTFDLANPLLSSVNSGARVVDLARPMENGMPQSPNHPQFRLSMPRRHGDKLRDDGGSAANDLLVTGTHVGTHIDALGHVSHCGELYGGVSAEEVQQGGRLASHGVDLVPPMVCRGILLDVPATLGIDACAGGFEITPTLLDRTVERQGTEPRQGDVVLIRTGWGRNWADGEAYVGLETGTPGVAEPGARWLADRGVRAVGADTIAFERIQPARGHAVLPAHRVLLVEEGIYIIEAMDLDGLAATGAVEFLFVLAPLKLVGATGSPVRPLAVLAA
jgi:kynurenine formamidase